MNDKQYYDAIVVGAGHAGVEAGLALARMGLETLVLSITLDNVGYLACNPSIGGTAKGHLVREVDALGGEMGKAADATLTQLRMLNRSKGAAVQSLRAQVDKYKYHDYMKRALENQPRLHLRQGEAKELVVENGEVRGVKTVYLMKYYAPVVVIASGVYLQSTIIVGDVIEKRGPVCFNRANYLSDSLRALGIEVRRFKTGTPARVKRSTVDLSALEIQEGETDVYSFSALGGKVNAKKRCCYLGYTNEATHDVIRENLSLSPKYSGLIHGVGARYAVDRRQNRPVFGQKPSSVLSRTGRRRHGGNVRSGNFHLSSGVRASRYVSLDKGLRERGNHARRVRDRVRLHKSHRTVPKPYAQKNQRFVFRRAG